MDIYQRNIENIIQPTAKHMNAMRQPKDTFKNILVATDMSPWGARAVARALRIPLNSQAKIIVLHVVDRNLSKSELKEHVSVLNEHVEKIRRGIKDSPPCTCVIASGAPVPTIINTASKHKAELIVLGRHGEKPISDLFIGSTAQRVARYGSISVLIVNNAATKPYSSILAAIDFSKVSIAAALFARRIAGKSLKNFRLIHAYSLPFPKSVLRRAGTTELELKKLEKSTRTEALAKMKNILEKNEALKSLAPKLLVDCTDARSAILNNSKSSELIVLGVYSRTALSYAFLGSVADFVMERTTKDVCLFRPKK